MHAQVPQYHKKAVHPGEEYAYVQFDPQILHDDLSKHYHRLLLSTK